MKKSKFTGEQIAYALRQADLGVTVAEVCRKMGIQIWDRVNVSCIPKCHVGLLPGWYTLRASIDKDC